MIPISNAPSAGFGESIARLPFDIRGKKKDLSHKSSHYFECGSIIGGPGCWA